MLFIFSLIFQSAQTGWIIVSDIKYGFVVLECGVFSAKETPRSWKMFGGYVYWLCEEKIDVVFLDQS